MSISGQEEKAEADGPTSKGGWINMGAISLASQPPLSPFYRKGKRGPEKGSTWEGPLAGLTQHHRESLV